MSNPVKINLRSESDTRAIKDTERELKELAASSQAATEATEKQADAQKNLNKTFDQSAKSATALYHIDMGLRQIASGHVLGGIRHLTSSLKGLWATLAANPIGAVITGVGALVAIMQRWRQRVQLQKQAEAEFRAELQANASALSEYRQTVDNRANAIIESLQGVGDAALRVTNASVWDTYIAQLSAAADAAERLRIQTEAMADLDLAEAMANIDLALASGDLTPADADRARAQARVDHGTARRAAARGEMDMREGIGEERLRMGRDNRDRTAEAALQASMELRRFRNRFADAGFTEDPEIEERALQNRIRRRQAMAMFTGSDPMDAPEYLAANQRLGQLQELRRIADQEEELSARRVATAQAAADAEKELAEARAAFNSMLQANAFQRQLLDRQESIAGTATAATRAQISQREQQEQQAIAARAAAEQQRQEEQARRDAERQQQAQQRQEEQARRDAERQQQAVLQEQIQRVISMPPVLPGQRQLGDTPGLDSSRAVRQDNARLNEAAAALNTFREQAASDRSISAEEADAILSLLGDMVQVAREIGGAGMGQTKAQIAALEREVLRLREIQTNAF